MPIEFQCEFCQGKLRVPEELAGKQARCSGCHEIVTVPDRRPHAPTPSRHTVSESRRPVPRRQGKPVAPLIGSIVVLLGVASSLTFLLSRDRTKGVNSFPPPAIPDPEKVARSIDEYKKSTALIKVSAGAIKGSGSGFLLQSDRGQNLIATNAHVVDPEELRLRGVRPRIQVVFDSGRRTERTFDATLIALDHKDDLAILRLPTIRDLPKPVTILEEFPLKETSTVHILGFPFGKALAAANRNPAITIGSGTISSLREDNLGNLKVIQIDGDVNPGNSGGPVIDARGRLVGVTVAKIRNSAIGFAIPIQKLRTLMKGGIPSISTLVTARRTGGADLTLSAVVHDIHGNGHRVLARYAPASRIRGELQHDDRGNWVSVADSKSVELPWRRLHFTGDATVGIANREKDYVVQAFLLDRMGRVLSASKMKRIVIDPDPVIVKRPPKPSPTKKPQPSRVDERRIIKMMPGVISDLVVGGGGRFLVLHIPGKRKLFIFDTHQSKMTHQISVLESKIAFAAGMNSLILALPDKRIFQVWNLHTGAREKVIPQSFPGRIQNLCMGSGSNGPVLVRRVLVNGNAERLAKSHTLFLDASLKPIEHEWIMKRKESFVTSDFIRASADGSAFTWRDGVGGEPHTIFLVRLEGKKAFVTEQGMSGSLVIPGPRARYLYACPGIYDPDVSLLHPEKPQRFYYDPFIPAHHRHYFLQLHQSQERKIKPGVGRIDFFFTGQYQSFASLEDIEGVIGERNGYGRRRDTIDHDKRVHLIPEAKLLITIPLTDDRLSLYQFDLDQVLQSTKTDYLVVLSQPPATAEKGRSLVYPIEVKSKKGGVTMKLESGPKGMKLDQNRLTWAIARDFKKKKVDVVISVKDSGGQELFHTFSIQLKE